MLWLGVNPSASTSASQANASASASASKPPSPTVASSPRSVDISRALWFIQCVGASDILARSRSGSATASSTAYTVDFTNSCTSWLKKQLAELTDPVEAGENASTPAAAASTPTPTPTAKPLTPNTATPMSRPPPSALSTSWSRSRWAAKWKYSMLLMSSLLANNLLDRRQWVGFIVDAFCSATLAQLAIVLTLVEDWFEDAFESAHLSASVVAAACGHLATLKDVGSGAAFAGQLIDSLSAILRKSLYESPDSFVSFTLWHKHRALLLAELGTDRGTKRMLDMAQQRSNALLFGSSPSSSSSSQQTSEAMHNASLTAQLDNFGGDPSTIDALFQHFATCIESATTPRDTVHTLLSWATTSTRNRSPWRPALVARLLQLMANRQEKEKRARKKSRRSDGSSSTESSSAAAAIDLTQCLIAWLEDLDALDEDQRPIHFEEVVALFAQLVDMGLFSYPRFLHRLTARGLAFSSTTTAASPASSSIDAPHISSAPTLDLRAASSLQVRLLRALPVPAASVSLIHQRRLAIYGGRAKETREEATHRRALRELGAVFAFLSNAEQAVPDRGWTRHDMLAALPHLWQANRFTLDNLLGVHLLPTALQWLSAVPMLNVEQVALLVSVLEEAQQWSLLVDLFGALLQRLADRSQEAAVAVGCVGLLKSVLAVHDNLWAARRPYNVLATKLAAVDAAYAKASAAAKAPLSPAALQAFTTKGDLGVLSLITERLQAHGEQQQLPQAQEVVDAFQAFLARAYDPDVETSALVEDADSLLRLAAASSGVKLDSTLRQRTSTPSQASVPTFASTLRALCIQDCLSVQAVLETLVLPRLIAASGEDTGEAATQEAGTPATANASALATSLLRSLFLRDMQDNDDIEQTPPCNLSEDLLLRAPLQTVDPSLLLRLAVQLANLIASRASPSHRPSEIALAPLLSSLLSQDSAQALIVAHPSRLRDAVGGDDEGLPAERRLGELVLLLSLMREDTTMGTVLVDDSVEVEVGSLVASAMTVASPLGTAFLVEEIGILLARLASATTAPTPAAAGSSEASKQRLEEEQVQAIASAVFEPLFLAQDGAGSLAHGLRLWHIGGTRFQAAIVELSMRAAAASLVDIQKSQQSATLSTALQRCEVVLATLRRLLLDGCEGQRLPATSIQAVEELFDRICQALEKHATDEPSPSRDANGTSSSSTPTLLYSLLLLLSRCSTFWASPATKSKLPPLIATTLMQKRLYGLALVAEPGSVDEDQFLQLRDTLVCLMSEMPAEMMAAVSTLLQQQGQAASPSFVERLSAAAEAAAVDAGGRHSLWSDRVQQMRRLMPSAPSNLTAKQAAGTTDLIVASSLQAAIEKGEWTAAPDRPWSWTMPLDSIAAAGATEAGASFATPRLPAATGPASTPAVLGPYPSVHAKHSHPLTLPPLANHLSLSLNLFAPRRTTGPLPDPEADWKASEAAKAGTAGDDDEDGWRAMRSERGDADGGLAEGAAMIGTDIGAGERAVSVGVAESGSSDVKRETPNNGMDVDATETKANEATDGQDGPDEKDDDAEARAAAEERRSLTAVSRFVGLPEGPVRTMEAYLQAEKQRMGASASANASAAAASSSSSTTAASGTAGTKKRSRTGSAASNASSTAGAKKTKGSAAVAEEDDEEVGGSGSKAATTTTRKRKNSGAGTAAGRRRRSASAGSAGGDGDAVDGGAASGSTTTATRGRGRGRGGGAKKRGG